LASPQKRRVAAMLSAFFIFGRRASRMAINGIIPQLRTTDIQASVQFYTDKLGFTLEFIYQDFYAGVSAGGQLLHLKLVDERDPSLAYVEEGGHLHLYIEMDGVAAFAEELRSKGVRLVSDVCETPWGTREFVIHDDQGHTLYFGEPLGDA
jgi:catechol 2,3-dioxygenase-like lactoylglutathione lyase family enzyme